MTVPYRTVKRPSGVRTTTHQASHSFLIAQARAHRQWRGSMCGDSYQRSWWRCESKRVVYGALGREGGEEGRGRGRRRSRSFRIAVSRNMFLGHRTLTTCAYASVMAVISWIRPCPSELRSTTQVVAVLVEGVDDGVNAAHDHHALSVTPTRIL